VKPLNIVLPPNITVETIGDRLGPYYYGVADFFFARSVLRRYPISHPFWKQFDVVHLNQTMGPSLERLLSTGVPVCLFIHHPVSADLAVAVEESSVFHALQWKLRYAPLIFMQRRLCHTLPCIATVSETSACRIAADYACPRGKIFVVPNGVEIHARDSKDVAMQFDVLGLGSFIHPRKGFRYLVHAYKLLSAAGYRIADIGRRSAEQRKLLTSIPHLTVFGTVSDAELQMHIASSRTLISTSLYEGFGLSIIEALASGKPAFAFDGGAVREVLTPIDPDLVVPLRDTAALVQRIIHFLQLPSDQAMEVGGRYRDAVQRLYPLRRAAEGLEALYSKIIEAHLV
jgi:glycosyltransferase involved in cell wall biosynthesis